MGKFNGIRVVGKVLIVHLHHHSVYIVFLVSNSPLVPASQEAVQDESKQSNRYTMTEYIVVALILSPSLTVIPNKSSPRSNDET